MTGDWPRIVLASYGVTVEVRVEDPALVPEVMAVLPPGWEPGDPAEVSSRFELGTGGALRVDGEAIPPRPDDPRALGSLDSALRAEVALHARERIFVHAGVVARAGRAIVMPGASWSGKTTLVAALVHAGATYYSDEFAVVDGDGRVHPFAKPLSLREPGTLAQRDVEVEDLGGRAGSDAAEVAVIARASYAAGETWAPRRGTVGEGALALLAHTIAARSRSEAALQAVRNAAAGAVYLEGVRGEAAATAAALLALIDAPGGTPPDPTGPTARGVPL